MKIDQKFLKKNKDYYRFIEKYDWVEVTDHMKGLEAIFHKIRSRIIKNLIRRYSIKGKFLDAGCGTGLLLRYLPKDSIGLDINPRNIEKAKIHAPNAKFIIGDIEKIPFGQNTFSTIICTEVIEHQPNPIPAIKELNRVLKKGGVLIGSTPAISFIWKFRFLSSTCPREEPFHKNFYEYELRELFKDFKVMLIKKSVLGMSFIFVLEKIK